MQRIIYTVLAAFVMALALGPILIPWLKRMKFGQTINELGPQSHKVKQGIPTMGGLIFALPALVAALIFAPLEADWQIVAMPVACMVGFGAIGFVDDFIKVKKKRSLGLTPIQKLVPQIILAVGIGIWAYLHPLIGSCLVVPFVGAEWNLGWFFVPAIAFVLVGTVNSANLLDGLDGLLGGTGTIDFASMSLICALLAAANPEMEGEYLSTAVFSGAMTGAVMGFLRYNTYPANVFMGDVGSFAIGGALAGIVLVTRLSLLLPLIAFTMLVSSLSDIIQIAYFKKTHGKRVFKMAPLHHHFELSGMPETKIVSMYNLVTLALCLVTLLGFTA